MPCQEHPPSASGPLHLPEAAHPLDGRGGEGNGGREGRREREGEGEEESGDVRGRE